MAPELSGLEQKLDYRFQDRLLVIQALTHPSHEHEKAGGGDYQRLEFLGDAVLGLVLTEELFKRFPKHDEGVLSRFRALLVNQETLAAIARGINLGCHIRLGKGEEQNAGRAKDSILADVLEALFAAVYLDSGFARARSLILDLYQQALEEREASLKVNDAKSELQEQLSARKLPTPVYILTSEAGPPHDRIFRFQVYVDDNVVGEGEGRTKKSAQQAAATEALRRFGGGAVSPPK